MAEPAARDSDVYEDDPDDTPLQQARKRQQRWTIELEAARKEMQEFQKDGREASARFRDERSATETEYNINDRQLRRLNVFPSDVQVKRDELFGHVPKVTVSRRYDDSKDQAARLAGIIMSRFLNFGLERDERQFSTTLERVLLDALTPGLGCAMARYVPEECDKDGNCLEPEDVEVFYLHWADVLWSACRVWEERRWFAHGCEMSRQDLLDNFTRSLGETLASEEMEPPAEEGSPEEEAEESPEEEEAEQEGGEDARAESREKWEALVEKLGREAVKRIPLDAQRGLGDSKSHSGTQEKDKKNYPWDRAYVWEIWDFERKQVVRMVEGYDIVLEVVDDPLELKTFLPLPEPLMANLTNDKCVPVSDWKLARGLYDEVDTLTARIAGLTRACRVAGCYDKTVGELARIFDEAEENRLVPVDNWSMFGDKGGIKGLMDFVPLEQIVSTLQQLTQERLNTLDLLRQVTGMADIMRGQQAQNGTPGEAAIKFQAASVRMRAWQKKFARFAGDIQSIKMEIAARRCSDDTLLERANCKYLMDYPDDVPQIVPGIPPNPQQLQALQKQQQQMALVKEALSLIRDRFHDYRIVVKPESIVSEDTAATRAERTEFVQTMADLLAKAQQAGAAMPAVIPGMLKIVKWAAAGLKGGEEVEGVFDEMVDAAAQAAAQMQANPQQPSPDALKLQAQQQAHQQKMEELQAKAQLDAQHSEREMRQDLLENQAEAQQHAADDEAAHQMKMKEDLFRSQLKLKEEQEKARMKPVRPPAQPKA